MIKDLRVEPTLLSHHLNVLKAAKLVSSKRNGKSVIYSIMPGADKQFKTVSIGKSLFGSVWIKFN